MEPVRFATEDGVSLEGELRRPQGKTVGSAVLCHAHPRHGGSKDHPILWAVRNELARRGFLVLAFNFRGTMRSAGTYGGGRTEVSDVRAGISRVREETQGPTIVCGWSFGANVAVREAPDDDRVAALALIGLPLEHDLDIPPMPSASELQTLDRPVLLLSGENDEYSPAGRLAKVQKALPRAELAIVAGTDHYLWRHEKEAATSVGEFAARVVTGGRATGP
ncbi:MAG: alpha/beta family hydrolase [Actinomycetota bacterium]